MADVNRGKRPLSPFMFGQVYRPQLNSMMSIAHRIAGVCLALPALLIVWWFHGAASTSERFAFVDGLLTSWLGGLILLGSAAALWFHFFNGIRHLFWDVGLGFDLRTAEQTGYGALAAAAVMTVITWFAAW